MSSVSCPEDVCNQALDAVGLPLAIADINDGSRNSRIAIRLFGQARDEVLRSYDWTFASADILLSSPLKSKTTAYGPPWDTATQPPPPWQYEWSLPSDFISVRAVVASPLMPGIQYKPSPVLYRLYWDRQLSSGQRVLLTMLNNPVLVYTSTAIDMTLWEPLFIASVVQNLARKFAPALGSLMAAPARQNEANAQR